MSWWERWKLARAIAALRSAQALLDGACGVGMGRNGFAFNEHIRSLEERVESRRGAVLRLLGMKP